MKNSKKQGRGNQNPEMDEKMSTGSNRGSQQNTGSSNDSTERQERSSNDSRRLNDNSRSGNKSDRRR